MSHDAHFTHAHMVRFDWPLPAAVSCIVGERSSRMIVVSALPPATRPSHPLASGRLTAITSTATTSMRNSMISHCRSRE